jgi:hypothetical protein
VLLAAIVEAQKWQVPTVVLWNTSPDALDAVSYLGKDLHIKFKYEQRSLKLLSVRPRSSDGKQRVRLCTDEFFMWN